MLRVIVEIVPQGIEWKADRIASMEIINVGGTQEKGDYIYVVSDDSGRYAKGSLNGFIRGGGSLKLVRDVLKRAL